MAAATRKGRSIMFDATSDTYAGQVAFICGITVQGTGMSVGDRILVQDDGDDPIADYLVTSATVDNADLWNGRDATHCNGLKMSGSTISGGTWALTVFLH